MDHRGAARILSKEYEEMGYSCRLDVSHKHPRFYIGDGIIERFVVLSSTQNYDQGNILDIKRQDIKKEILPWLMKPEVKMKAVKEEAPPKEEVQDNTVYPSKISIHRGGHLAVFVPKSAIPSNRQQAIVKLTSDHRLYIQFMSEGGTSFGKTRSEDTVSYIFPKNEVPFKFVDKKPPDYKAQEQSARFRSGCLIFDTPFPEELRVSNNKSSKHEFSMEDGKELLAMFHEWVEQAEKAGLEPELNIQDNRIKISIIEKRRMEL